MANERWKNRVPATGAVEHIRSFLRCVLDEIGEGRIEAVARSLQRESWLKDHDLTSVPPEVVAETRERLADAEAALRRGDDPLAASEAILAALRLW